VRNILAGPHIEHALRGDALTTSGCNVSKIMVPVLQLMEKNHDTNNQECGMDLYNQLAAVHQRCEETDNIQSNASNKP
jgi:hypothetical protein